MILRVQLPAGAFQGRGWKCRGADLDFVTKGDYGLLLMCEGNVASL
jgi:hypothetical protein